MAHKSPQVTKSMSIYCFEGVTSRYVVVNIVLGLKLMPIIVNSA